jgi:hypothetical protein
MIKSRRMRWEGHIARIGRRRRRVLLVGKPDGRRPLGRPTRRFVDNTNMYVGIKEYFGMD